MKAEKTEILKLNKTGNNEKLCRFVEKSFVKYAEVVIDQS